MTENSKFHVHSVEDQIEAWDKYVAAVLSAMSFKDLKDEQKAITTALRVADDLLAFREEKKRLIHERWMTSPRA